MFGDPYPYRAPVVRSKKVGPGVGAWRVQTPSEEVRLEL